MLYTIERQKLLVNIYQKQHARDHFHLKIYLYMAWEKLSLVSNLADLGGALVNPDMVVRSSGKDLYTHLLDLTSGSGFATDG